MTRKCQLFQESLQLGPLPIESISFKIKQLVNHIKASHQESARELATVLDLVQLLEARLNILKVKKRVEI